MIILSSSKQQDTDIRKIEEVFGITVALWISNPREARSVSQSAITRHHDQPITAASHRKWKPLILSPLPPHSSFVTPPFVASAVTSQQWRTEVAKRIHVRLRGAILYWSCMHCCDWSAENELFWDTFILLVWIFHVQLFADCSLTWCVAGWRHFKQSDFKFLSTTY